MKTLFPKHVRFFCVLCLPVYGVTPGASAQTSAGLDIQLYAGLTITGPVGTVYSIEYVTDLAQTNAWRCLEFLQLSASPYLWTDKSSPATGRRFYQAVQFNTPTNLVFIPPGNFRMGSLTNEVDRDVDESPQTAVTLAKGFCMGKYHVTQEDYQAVVGTNPSNNLGDTSRPVEAVTWSDAVNYCAKRTQQEAAVGSIPPGSLYRLPTEAEWEYTCRAWSSTRFSYGDDPGYTKLPDHAWYLDNSDDMTHPVGQKLASPWGLYDMPGNVWDWCRDWYGPYSGGSRTDPQGPTSGSERVIRGESFLRPATEFRSASRYHQIPDVPDGTIGFRVVLAPDQP
jgi:formylglycine-generating enzyme required for sulfatase activity